MTSQEEIIDNLVEDRIVSWIELAGKHFDPLEWAVDGLIPEGYGLIVAPPKAGKSWLVLDLAVACSTGGTTLGGLKAKKRPVLYLALEDGQRRLRERLDKLSAVRNAVPSDDLRMVTEADALEAELLIAQFIDKHADEKPLIILDTLGKVMPGKSGGDNEYQRDYRFGSKMKALVAAMPGGTLLGIHHTNKGIHDDFQNAVSGTQGIAGAADFTVVINRRRGKDEAVLSITGRDVPEAEYGMTFDAGIWSISGGNLDDAREAVEEIRAAAENEDGLARVGDSINRVVNYVNGRSGEVVTPKEVAQHLGMSNEDAGKYLGRAAKSGLVERTGRGKYLSKLVKLSKSQVEGEKVLDTHLDSVQILDSGGKTPEQHKQPGLDTLDSFHHLDRIEETIISSLSVEVGLTKHTLAGSIPRKLDPERNLLDPALNALEAKGRIVQDLHGRYKLIKEHTNA